MVKKAQSETDLLKYIRDIFRPVSTIIEEVSVPYEERDDLATKCNKLLKKISALGRKQGRIQKLIYYYYMGEELANYNSHREKWRNVVKEKKISNEKRHYTNAIRTYKLFRLTNKETIYNTVDLNSNLIGELSAKDYKALYDSTETFIINFLINSQNV
jgi:hypothetical protein